MGESFIASIIVPCYNGENVIEPCIDSIVRQIDDSYQLILIDNGSVDKTGEILKKYINGNNIIGIEYKENQGVSYARNDGLRVAEGKYIFFYDCDDFIPKGSCKRMINEAELTGADVVIANGAFRDDDHIAGITQIENCDGDFERIMCNGVIWNKIYKKTFLDENGIKFKISNNHGEDTLFLGKIAEAKGKVAFITDVVYHHIMHYSVECSNLSRQFTLKNLLEYLEVGIEIYTINFDYPRHNVYKCYIDYFRYMWVFWKQIPPIDLKTGYEELKKYISIHDWSDGNERGTFNLIAEADPAEVMSFSFEEYVQLILQKPRRTDIKSVMINRNIVNTLGPVELAKVNVAWAVGMLEKVENKIKRNKRMKKNTESPKEGNHMEETDKKVKIKQAVILAGGYGNRLKPFTDTAPKPMYPLYGRPFLEYIIEQVKTFGITDILILLGHLPEKIKEYFGDGSKFGVNITYSTTPAEYETGYRLSVANKEGKVQDEFMLLYCDNYCPIDYNKLVDDYERNNADIQASVYLNLDGYTKNNMLIDISGRVQAYDKTHTLPNLQGVEIAYSIIKKRVLDYIPEGNVNFETSVFPKIVAKGKMFATITEHRYYSIGSWERIKLTEKFFSKQKYIFLDRDGTINVRAPKAYYVTNSDDFIWLPRAKEAILKLNQAGYKIILITNQPGIAKGLMTDEDLDNIHNKMQSELAEIGAKIDQIYVCKHGWDDNCRCRKPKPGMLFDAQKDNSLDLTKCYLIGDDERDEIAGRAAGCKVIRVSPEFDLMDAVEQVLKEDE